MADGFRLRVCFRKVGRLRYLSHLETVRACERAARRAALPYAVSQGFTPRMRVAFGPALPVGYAGEREWYDLWLTQFVSASGVLDALKDATVADLAPRECAYVAPRGPSLAASLTIAQYDVVVEGGIPPEELERSLAALVKTGTFAVEHKGKQKVFDLADALPKEPEVTVVQGATIVRMTVRMGEKGSLRPDVFVAAATDAALDVTRTDLLIEDEGAWRRPL